MRNTVVKIIIPMLLPIVIVACGGSGRNTASATAPKDLFSLWTHTKYEVEKIDLTRTTFDTAVGFNVIYTGGATCHCAITMRGTQNDGTYTINDCFYVIDSGNTGDPDCNILNTTGTFTKDHTTLTLCDSSLTCNRYK